MHQQPEGFLLITMRDVDARLPASMNAPPLVSGPVSLECVTFPAVRSDERDVWLVLRIGGYEIPIAPTQIIKHTRSERKFVFEALAPQDTWSLQLREPNAPHEMEDVETFEVILAQYAALEDVPDALGNSGADKDDGGFEDYKGKLVLIDEGDGKVVGSLGGQLNIKEDVALHQRGKEKDPVVIDIPADHQDGQDVYVHPLEQYEDPDFIMKSASLMSRGMVFATGALETGITAASSFYVAHSKPNEKPLEFSERTHENVRRVHKISGQAVAVSTKTTGLISDAIDSAVGYLSGRKSPAPAPSPGRPTSPAPPRGSYFSFKTPGANGVSGSGASSGLQTPALPPQKPGTPGSSGLLSPMPTPPPLPPRPPLRNRILLSTDLLLTTLEGSAKRLAEHGTIKLSEALGHKYGKDLGEATRLVGYTAQNVGLVYIDARGVGRRALLRKAGKKFIKAKLGKNDVVLGVDDHGRLAQPNAGSSKT